MGIASPTGPPAGTFVAQVRDGYVRFPPPFQRFCEAGRWTLFRVLAVDENCLEIRPILPDDDDDVDAGYHASLSPDGRLWIPALLREAVSLGEQSVMMRVEQGHIRIYLRNVFQTLGFRP